MNTTKKGLTLIELLIVVSILSILIGLLLPNLNDIRKQARDKRRKADVASIRQALELYKMDQSPPAYPTNRTPTPEVLVVTPGVAWTVGTTTYMNKFPTDPLYSSTPDPYTYYYTQVDANTYYIGTCIENPNDPDKRALPAGVTWSTGCTAQWYYLTQP